jgi:protein-disulfide isomerase
MSEDETILAEPVSTEDHMQGPLTAPVTLVEYGDYECPACGAAYPILKEVKKRMGNRLCFVFRNFPLSEMHRHAFAAAVAAEAAGAQGKFWEMHDTLYENQRTLSDRAIQSYAETLRLDIERFTEDTNSETFSARVKNDFQTGLMSGVNGTPSLFINGERYDGARDFESLLNVLQGVADETSSA